MFSERLAKQIGPGFMLAAFFAYLYAFWTSLPYWFNPEWTTDDALQQWFMFHDVLGPKIFEGDLITEVMKGYLAPLHYWLCYAMTWLIGDVIQASHAVMLLQVGLSALFVFLLVRRFAGTSAGLFAVMFLLHTRESIQRATGGVPRGWALVLLPALLYCAGSHSHRLALLVLLCGCLLHPPATIICALTYGLFLLCGFMRSSSRENFRKPLFWLVLLAPFYVLITFSVVRRPAHVGQMVTLQQAETMPQFSRPDGRFPFVPLSRIVDEIDMFAFQSIRSRFHKPIKVLRRHGEKIGVALLLLLLVVGWIRMKNPLPPVYLAYLLSIAVVYLASRELAFYLYVPDRHLQMPLAIFFVTLFPIVVWRSFHTGDPERSAVTAPSNGSFIGLALLALFIYACSGWGLKGSANFNYFETKKGYSFRWIRKNTPTDALIAGHPKFIDGVMLFGKRRAFATNEVYHPFYRGYLETIEDRIETSFKAHYARDLRELASVLEGTDVDYFIFEKQRFYPEALEEEEFHPPIGELVEELTSRHYTEYAYKQLPREVNTEEVPYLVFRDAYSAVVDLRALREALAKSGGGAAANET